MGKSSYINNIRKKIGNELLVIPSAMNIIINEKEELLLVKLKDEDIWVPPGGGIEPNETPSEAAVREMYEETNLVVEPLKIIGVFGGGEFFVEYSNGDKVSYIAIFFLSRIISGEIKIEKEEITDIKYFSIKELKTINVRPWIFPVLNNIEDLNQIINFQFHDNTI